MVTTASPLSHGFPLGYYFAFHGISNVNIKTKLHRLYSRFCPALLTGSFIDDKGSSTSSSANGASDTSHSSASAEQEEQHVSDDTDGFSDDHIEGHHDHEARRQPHASVLFSAGPPAKVPSSAPHMTSSENTVAATEITVNLVSEANHVPTPPESVFSSTSSISSKEMKPHRAPVIRVGFASRHFTDHPVGYLTERVIEAISTSSSSVSDAVHTHLAGAVIHVTVFFIASVRRAEDRVQARIAAAANSSVFLSTDLHECLQAMRAATLDLLIYPELGMDPISYFLSFARIAKTHATWLGHADTSGVPNVQYFISSQSEAPGTAFRYTETLHLMRGLGTCFVDNYSRLSQVRLIYICIYVWIHVCTVH